MQMLGENGGQKYSEREAHVPGVFSPASVLVSFQHKNDNNPPACGIPPRTSIPILEDITEEPYAYHMCCC